MMSKQLITLSFLQIYLIDLLLECMYNIYSYERRKIVVDLACYFACHLLNGPFIHEEGRELNKEGMGEIVILARYRFHFIKT